MPGWWWWCNDDTVLSGGTHIFYIFRLWMLRPGSQWRLSSNSGHSRKWSQKNLGRQWILRKCHLRTYSQQDVGHIRMNSFFEDPLYGFGHNMVPIRGTDYFPILLGTSPKQFYHTIRFYVINSSSSYNMILGRPTLTKLQEITSTTHLKAKFPTSGGVGKVKGDREMAGRCYGKALVMAETKPKKEKKHSLYQKDKAGRSTWII